MAMSEQIEGCPQPETPIRERAWADGQRPEPKYSDAEVDRVAKLIADKCGNGMREKYEDVARTIVEYLLASRSAEAVRGGWRDPNTAPVSTPMHQVYFLANCPNDDWSPGGNVHFACYYGDQGQCRPTGTNGSRAFNGWMPIPPAMQEQSHD